MLLRFDEALERVLALGHPAIANAEEIDLDEAEGRFLAEDVLAPADVPGFDYSSMDGYAVSTRDLAGGVAVTRPVVGESRTGAVPPKLAPKSVMRIFTGAALPEGADAVIMQERVTREGDVARLDASVTAGQNVRRRGDDLRAGGVAIARGTRLRPAHLALAASVDRARLVVTTKPTVAILATGDELRRPGTEPVPGMIPEANTVALRAMARRAGARTKALPYVRDDRGATERAFASALTDADVVVTIGGVSVGDHDLVRPALEAVGVTIELWRVAIKPGKPLAIGRFPRAGKRDAIVVGLPGNPASALVTFALFGVPLLRAMQGDALPFPAPVRARMTRAIVHDPGRLEFARAVVARAEGRPGELTVTTFGNQASGALTSMAQANALACIPAEANGVRAGDEVDVILLSDLEA